MTTERTSRMDPVLGLLTPADAPIWEEIGDDADFEVSIFANDGVTNRIRVRLEMEYTSHTFGEMDIEKFIDLPIDYLKEHGVSTTVTAFEERFDALFDGQLPFVNLTKRIEIRNALLTCLEVALPAIVEGMSE